MESLFTLTYKGKAFNQRQSDNYVNVGQLCATHGKYFKDWKRNKSSQDYIEALAETLAEKGRRILPPEELVVSAINESGGNAGTWAHPLVAIEVARWINPKFGVWCNQHIRTLMEKGHTEIERKDKASEQILAAMLQQTSMILTQNQACIQAIQNQGQENIQLMQSFIREIKEQNNSIIEALLPGKEPRVVTTKEERVKKIVKENPICNISPYDEKRDKDLYETPYMFASASGNMTLYRANKGRIFRLADELSLINRYPICKLMIKEGKQALNTYHRTILSAVFRDIRRTEADIV